MANPRKVLHSRGFSWEFTYRVNGRMVRQRFPTRSLALDAMAKARLEIRAGTHLAPMEAKLPLSRYIERWTAGLQVAPSTRAHYEICVRRHIIPALGDARLSSIRRPDIINFVSALVQSGLAPTTIETIYTVLAMILRSAVYDRIIPESPCYKIKLPPKPYRRLPVLNSDEIRALLATTRPQHHAAIATAVGTGLRQAELLGLRLPRINFLRRELAVEEQCLTPAGRPARAGESYRSPGSSSTR
jgi:integrase